MTRLVGPPFSIKRFEAADIDPAAFDHAAHVYVAWLYIGQYGTESALQRFDAALRRVTRRFGVPEKYHATITGFMLTLIADRFDALESWQAFRCRNTDLLRDGRRLLANHYSAERLASPEARRRFLPPDNAAA